MLDESDDVSQERKKVNVFATVVEEPQDVSQVIDVNRFSTLGKLLRYCGIGCQICAVLRY